MTMNDAYPGLPDPRTRPEFYAGVPFKRGLAWFADAILIGLLTAVAVPFTAFTGLFFLPLLFLVIGFLYRWVTLAGGSATLGMRLMSIELRDRYGEQPATRHLSGSVRRCCLHAGVFSESIGRQEFTLYRLAGQSAGYIHR